MLKMDLKRPKKDIIYVKISKHRNYAIIKLSSYNIKKKQYFLSAVNRKNHENKIVVVKIV